MAEQHDIPAPTPTSELDETLKGVADQANKLLRRTIMAMGVAMVAIIAVSGVLVRWALTEHSRVDSYVSGSCPFYYPVAIVPVAANTSQLGVDLVEGARIALARQACPEKIPPPSRELLVLGRKYGITITY